MKIEKPISYNISFEENEINSFLNARNALFIIMKEMKEHNSTVLINEDGEVLEYDELNHIAYQLDSLSTSNFKTME